MIFAPEMVATFFVKVLFSISTLSVSNIIAPPVLALFSVNVEFLIAPSLTLFNTNAPPVVAVLLVNVAFSTMTEAIGASGLVGVQITAPLGALLSVKSPVTIILPRAYLAFEVSIAATPPRFVA